jgi:hypothetical protein
MMLFGIAAVAWYIGRSRPQNQIDFPNLPVKSFHEKAGRRNTSERCSKSLFGKSIPEYNQKQRAGLVQWQNGCFPSFL